MQHLREANLGIKKLRFLLRLAADLRLLGRRRYEHAARTLGHAIGGVHGVYNRHNYIEEKKDALARLAKLIENIINPPDRTNVVSIVGR